MYLLFIFILLPSQTAVIVSIDHTEVFQANIDCDLVQVKSAWLPSSVDIIRALEKIVKAFEDAVQVELVRARWEEIKRLQAQPVQTA